MSNPSSDRPRYKNPPVVERVLSIVGDIKTETFYSQFESWRTLVTETFPEYDPIKEWMIKIEQNKEGMPLLGQGLPEVKITHRFWRRNELGKRFLSMRILPDKMTLNLHREEGRPHTYEELRHEVEQWFPRWYNHFGLTGCSTVQLHYVNILSPQVTPQLTDREGSVLVGKALKVFSGVPTRHHGIIPPYDCQMGLSIDPKRDCAFHLRVRGLLASSAQGSAVRVDFVAHIDKGIGGLSLSSVVVEADFLHQVMVEHFEAIFTDEAKQGFEPEAK